MKINRRPIPLNLLSVEDGLQKIVVSADKAEIIIQLYTEGSTTREAHFSFFGLWDLIDKRLKGSTQHTDQ